MSVELGRTAYTAYGATTGGRTHDGRPMPTWDDLGDLIRAAWIAAALAASARVEHHLESIDRRLTGIENRLSTVITKENKLMSGQADIDASVAAVGAMVTDLRDSVVPGISGAQAKLDKVIADIEAGNAVDTSALAEVTAALTEARTGLDSTVAALVADPNIPTDAPVEGGPTADGGGNTPA